MPFPGRDFTGQTFGRLTVTGNAPRGDRTKHRWVQCQCECGNLKAVRLQSLTAGRIKSCGCLHLEQLAANHAARLRPLTGRRYGRLLVMQPAPSRREHDRWVAYWECRCDCGTLTVVQRSALVSGATKSCGCLLKEVNAALQTRHGGTYKAEYKVWASMLQRCENPKHTSFHHYGGRGITVAPEWHDFARFIADMGPRPSDKHSLDRTDNEKGYGPTNTRWATRLQQANNRRILVDRRVLEDLQARVARLEALYGPLEDHEEVPLDALGPD